MNTANWLGLITGMLFGFLLQKGRVLRFEKQIGALLFKDMTIFKFMLSAILVGMVGLTLMSQNGMIELSRKSMNLGGVVLGGALFGVGWGIMGFCPGTAAGALGEGRWHALFGIIGMLLGAAIYAQIFPCLDSSILAWADYGKIGLPETIGLSDWTVIAIFWAVTLPIFYIFERFGI